MLGRYVALAMHRGQLSATIADGHFTAGILLRAQCSHARRTSGETRTEGISALSISMLIMTSLALADAFAAAVNSPDHGNVGRSMEHMPTPAASSRRKL